MRYSTFIKILITIIAAFSSNSLIALDAKKTKADELTAQIDSLYKQIFINPNQAKSALQLRISELQNIISDTSLSKYYNLLGISYAILASPDSAVFSFERAKELYPSSLNNSAQLNKNLGNVYKNIGQIQKAFDYYYQALYDAITAKNTKLKATIYSEISSTYSLINKFDLATEYLINAIQLYEKEPLEDSISLFIAYQKLANLYSRQFMYKEAEPYYQKALQGLKNTHRKDAYYLTVVSFASMYIHQNKLDAVEWLLKEAEQGMMDIEMMAFMPFLYSKYGKYYYMLGDYVQMNFYFQKSLKDFYSNNPHSIASFIEYADVLKKLNDKESLEALMASYDLNSDSLHLMPADKVLFLEIYADFLAQKGKLEEAYKIMRQCKYLSDSLQQNNNNEAIYGIMKKAALDEQLQDKIVWAQEAELSKRRSIFYLMLLLFILVIAIYLVRLNNYKNKILTLENQRLEEMRKKVQEQLNLQKKDVLDKSNENLILKEKLQKIINKAQESTIKEIDITQLQADETLLKSIIHRSELLEANWLDALKLKAPQLTRGDLEFCLLLHLGLNYKDIAQLLNISHASVHTKKYRLCKKLGLDKEVDIQAWLALLQKS